MSRRAGHQGHTGDDELIESGKRLNDARADFLKLDVATALTFSGIALNAEDGVKKDRNRRAARRAYDTILRFIATVHLTRDDTSILHRNLARLKSELARLGEAV